jgi:antitoxin component of MazEF toxin-antitoxin module
MEKITFTTTIRQDEGKNTTGIAVPAEVIQKLGTSKKPAVKVSIGNYTYRSTVAVRGNEFMVSLSAENRAGAGVKGGDAVEVAIELDTEPRTVEVPADLAAALTEKQGLWRRLKLWLSRSAKNLSAKWKRLKHRKHGNGAFPAFWQN